MQAGLRAKPEVGVQFGAGGASGEAALQVEGSIDPSWAIEKVSQRSLKQIMPGVRNQNCWSDNSVAFLCAVHLFIVSLCSCMGNKESPQHQLL